MDMTKLEAMIREQAESCRSIEDLSDFLSAFLAWGILIEEGPDGREDASIARFTVQRLGRLRIEIRPREHGVPHFHVVGGGINASFAIETGEHLAGEIESSERKRIEVWCRGSREQLIKAWNNSRPDDCPVGPILP